MTEQPLIAYYGDDFTGSTDVMEALSANGVETVLFTRIPSDTFRARFATCRAVGLAGTSRSRSPEWMDAELPAAFDWLAGTGARFLHYKVCSTFDSSPRRGSIGRAVEIARRQLGQQTVPILVGVPQLRRYTFAGHLFAAYRDKIYRIDRHPVMSHHPATPMTESDLLLHLAAQTDLDSGLITAADDTTPASAMVLLDVHDTETQQWSGAWLARFAERQNAPLACFIVGSSGVEYALLPHWNASGEAAPRPSYPALQNQPRIAVVSGSCSPTTARQIETASNNGFSCIPADYNALVSGVGAEAAYDAAMGAATSALSAGNSTIIYTALGPDAAAAQSGTDNDDRAGKALGQMISTLRLQQGLDRIVVAGGDTSSHALGEMEIGALTLRHPIAESPGSPVCLAHPDGAGGKPFELILKGGQIGRDDYFVRMRDGNV